MHNSASSHADRQSEYVCVKWHAIIDGCRIEHDSSDDQKMREYQRPVTHHHTGGGAVVASLMDGCSPIGTSLSVPLHTSRFKLSTAIISS